MNTITFTAAQIANELSFNGFECTHFADTTMMTTPNFVLDTIHVDADVYDFDMNDTVQSDAEEFIPEMQKVMAQMMQPTVPKAKAPVVKAAKFGAEHGEQVLHSYGCHTFEKLVDNQIIFTIVRQEADDKNRKCNPKKFCQHTLERSKLMKNAKNMVMVNLVNEPEMNAVKAMFDSWMNAKFAQTKLEEIVLAAIEAKKNISEYLPAMDDIEEALDAIVSLKKLSALQHYVVDGIMNDLSIAEGEIAE